MARQALVTPFDQYGDGEDSNWIGYGVVLFEDNGCTEIESGVAPGLTWMRLPR